jgi:Vam6/Vps39-like protein vacuolar protein sorting-associated protein 39
MVHSAFHIEPVLKKTQFKITALEVWGQKVLVGTEEGALLVLEEQSGSHIVEFEIVESRKSFSKKPLIQIQAVDALGIILSLSADLLQVNDLTTLDMRAQLLKTRGAHCFSISVELDPPVLCCAVKKTLVLYRWDGSLFSEWKEINVSDVPRSLVWCGDSICTNMTRKYHLINVFSLSDKSLFDCNSAVPTIFRLPGKREMLLGRDSISVFQDFEGRPSRKYAVTWSDAPIACVHSTPFILGVLPKSVEVQLAETQSVVQSMSLRATHVAAGADGAVLVVANNCVYRLRPVPMARQVPPCTRSPYRPG